MVDESLDYLRLTATVVVLCIVVTAVFYFYTPIREATVRQLDGLADMQRSEALGTVHYLDGQTVSGAEAKQLCIRYQNSNIAHAPAPSSIADLQGLYSISVNYDTVPVTITFTPVASSDIY